MKELDRKESEVVAVSTIQVSGFPHIKLTYIDILNKNRVASHSMLRGSALRFRFFFLGGGQRFRGLCFQPVWYTL